MLIAQGIYATFFRSHFLALCVDLITTLYIVVNTLVEKTFFFNCDKSIQVAAALHLCFISFGIVPSVTKQFGECIPSIAFVLLVYSISCM